MDTKPSKPTVSNPPPARLTATIMNLSTIVIDSTKKAVEEIKFINKKYPAPKKEK